MQKPVSPHLLQFLLGKDGYPRKKATQFNPHLHERVSNHRDQKSVILASGISEQNPESSPYFQLQEVSHQTGNALFGCNFLFYAVKTALEPYNNLQIYL
jgi:hypothetical protein